MVVRVKSCLCFDLELSGLLIGYFELIYYTIASIWMFFEGPEKFPFEFSISFAG